MKKILVVGMLCLSIIVCLAGCSKKVTLNLACGDKTGTYSGDMVDGVPNGQGEFTSENSEGKKWTYTGEFKNGHFDGEGKTTWENGQTEIGTYKDDVIVPLKGKEINALFTTPEKFKDNYVEVVGRVFTAPEYIDGGVCIQMFADLENSDNNTIVYIYDDTFDVKQDDYVKVVGCVGEPFTGENAFGGEITAPTVTAREYEKISYKDAVVPTLKAVEINQTQTQFGYSVTIEKIEFAEKETRVYIKVDNQGTAPFNAYSFNTKITQNGKQYDEQDNWNASYPEIQADLLVGNSTEGIIAFPALKEESFTFIIEAHSDNWGEDIKPYTFNITL